MILATERKKEADKIKLSKKTAKKQVYSKDMGVKEILEQMKKEENK